MTLRGWALCHRCFMCRSAGCVVQQPTVQGLPVLCVCCALGEQHHPLAALCGRHCRCPPLRHLATVCWVSAPLSPQLSQRLVSLNADAALHVSPPVGLVTSGGTPATAWAHGRPALGTETHGWLLRKRMGGMQVWSDPRASE